MKTIEERAEVYAFDVHPNEPFFSIWKEAYIEIATEQKIIDDKVAFEEREKAFKAGYDTAIETACEWFGNYLMDIGCPDDWMRDSKVQSSGEQRFRKAMEE